MRQYCESASQYGDAACPTNVKHRHVTIILNPNAKKGFVCFSIRIRYNCHGGLQGKILKLEIPKILQPCEYVGDFLLITMQFLFAA